MSCFESIIKSNEYKWLLCQISGSVNGANRNRLPSSLGSELGVASSGSSGAHAGGPNQRSPLMSLGASFSTPSSDNMSSPANPNQSSSGGSTRSLFAGANFFWHADSLLLKSNSLINFNSAAVVRGTIGIIWLDSFLIVRRFFLIIWLPFLRARSGNDGQSLLLPIML